MVEYVTVDKCDPGQSGDGRESFSFEVLNFASQVTRRERST